jgi:hypothetical protein
MIKQQLPFCFTRRQFKLVEKFSEVIKKSFSMYKNQRTTFVISFTKTTVATWSINMILPVSKALDVLAAT